MKTKPDPELARWCRDLAASSAATDVVPPNWYTTVEIAKAYGRSPVTIATRLKQQVAKGRA